MSLYDIYVWLTELDFPSISAIWTWLIFAPWWLAIGTVVFSVFAVRITWSMAFYFINWVFDWTFRAGFRFGKWLNVAKKIMATLFESGKSVKQKAIALFALRARK